MIYAESRATNPYKKSFFEKVKEYKTEITIVNITVVSAVGAILIAKNRDSIKGQTVSNLFKNGVKANDDIISHIIEAVEKGPHKIYI